MTGGSLTVIEHAWREPAAVLAAFADEPWAFGLFGADGGWSYAARAPAATLLAEPDDGQDVLAGLRNLRGPLGAPAQAAPPFAGGVVGLAAYELGARLEPAVPQGRTAWPDLAAARYDAILAFDGAGGRVLAVGRGADSDQAKRAAAEASAWLDRPAAPGAGAGNAALDDLTGDAAYAESVAQVVQAVARGDLFQANVARLWAGRLDPGLRPFDIFARLLSDSPAPFAAYLRLPGRAVVSNSPERFLRVEADGAAFTQPIKGTRPRGGDAAADAALVADLLASEKDRAENRMIVDLMRNDLARACAPGSVDVTTLFAVETYANVHHLVSTVRGRLAPGRDALDLFLDAFPPGSVTGAPKVQAMIEIARHEPPRGPYCGSLFWAGADGAFDSSVLIRTLAFAAEAGGWRVEGRAGAGIVADSDPAAEAAEARTKFLALQKALAG
jgi:para-aminobenzoate synthetase component 1